LTINRGVEIKNEAENQGGPTMSVQKLKSTDAFNSVIHKGVSLVDFNAPWCAPCRMQEPILETLSVQYQGKATVAAVDIDQNRDVAIKMGIHSIPTLVVFRDGREVERFVGVQPEFTLTEALDTWMETPTTRQ
jgi:thioredoxin 1